MPKKILLAFPALIVILAFLFLEAQQNKPGSSPLLDFLANGRYDGEAARVFGADDYGMKKYVMAFLKKGPDRPGDPEKSRELQRAHLQNIERLAGEGKLVLAGPFLADGELRGIYIFNVESIAEAAELTRSDPAVRYGSLVMELHEWYGSAALPAINDLHRMLSKKAVSGSD